MAEIDLTQEEAKALLSIEKHRVDDQLWKYPSPGLSLSIPLVSYNRRENFVLDISRGKIDLLKGKYQTRGRMVVVLARLDFGGAPHRNPDGQEISSPHLHVYREGFGDKWATPLPPDNFSSSDDFFKMFDDFMGFCNITNPPNIARVFV